ncbi:LysR substrate-binding domain-containing protein [Oceanospirillum beijerinckii]|uniref:LysR substrate-binding domain-containing protein n=1 Tax=Oceanospirillum beijerinckii TaxID=64976 RepID=UPI0003FEFD6A|nr:LysR substrate-binding domain-containing protein [Oceanospirillum beijerinckii]
MSQSFNPLSASSSRLPPLKALRVFAVAAQLESFKLAAEQLFVTQAAVSQQIRLLEEHLGQKLFIRLNREVRLTPSGQLLLPYALQAFDLLDKGVTRLMDDPNPQHLVISCLPSFAGRWLVPRLGAFQRQHPDLSISINPKITLETFDSGDVDVAVRFGLGQYPDLQAEFLLDDYLLPVCSPKLLEQYDLGQPNLGDMPILADNALDQEEVWQAFTKKAGLTKGIHSVLLITDATMLVDAILSGQGLSLVRFSLAYQLIESGQLVCPLPYYWLSDYAYYLVAPEHHFKRPKLQQLQTWILEEVKEVEQSWTRIKQALLLDFECCQPERSALLSDHSS